MADQVFIQHRFTIERDGQSYTDALVVPLEDYNKLSPQEIEAQKNERFSNWQSNLNSTPLEPTKEEQLASLDRDLIALEEQKTLLLSQRVEVSALVDAPVDVKPVKGGK